MRPRSRTRVVRGPAAKPRRHLGKRTSCHLPASSSVSFLSYCVPSGLGLRVANIMAWPVLPPVISVAAGFLRAARATCERGRTLTWQPAGTAAHDGSNGIAAFFSRKSSILCSRISSSTGRDMHMQSVHSKHSQ